MRFCFSFDHCFELDYCASLHSFGSVYFFIDSFLFFLDTLNYICFLMHFYFFLIPCPTKPTKPDNQIESPTKAETSGSQPPNKEKEHIHASIAIPSTLNALIQARSSQVLVALPPGGASSVAGLAQRSCGHSNLHGRIGTRIAGIGTLEEDRLHL